MSTNTEDLLAADSGHLLVHFFLDGKSHEMDALVLHACEGELLGLVKEIGKQLDVGLGIQTKAYGEGGLEIYLTFIGRHAIALGLVGATLTALCSSAIWWNYQSKLLDLQIAQNEFNLQRDKKLTQQQIEQNDLKLKKARIELKRLEQDTSADAQKSPATASNRSLPIESSPQVEDILPGLLNNRRLIKLRSQFYENLLTYEKVTAVGFAPAHDTKLEDQRIVHRSDFGSYVVRLSEIEPDLIRNVEIEIVAPVLKRGMFKWRGVFEKHGINFDLLDEVFLTKVISKKVKFQNGTTLLCDLKVFLRENEAGEVEPHAYAVQHVHKHYNKAATRATDILISSQKLPSIDEIHAANSGNQDDSGQFSLELNDK